MVPRRFCHGLQACVRAIVFIVLACFLHHDVGLRSTVFAQVVDLWCHDEKDSAFLI